jgi:hypothetical protein
MDRTEGRPQDWITGNLMKTIKEISLYIQTQIILCFSPYPISNISFRENEIISL